MPILVQAHDGAIELIGARWGLIPAWWNDDKASYDIQCALRRGGGQADVTAEHALHVLSDACAGLWSV
ncbi:MAG: hypothetical protein A3H44_10695 [Gammaproteobacteria bacterium RIFCSPLOWO2_02_FULL_57_10]|nr:MAG: hypothetical protein A3H44_10695 [Gammaproteobacteria bacterium RIFCSPLOWO2_02_FULL_57_10]